MKGVCVRARLSVCACVKCYSRFRKKPARRSLLCCFFEDTGRRPRAERAKGAGRKNPHQPSASALALLLSHPWLQRSASAPGREYSSTGWRGETSSKMLVFSRGDSCGVFGWVYGSHRRKPAACFSYGSAVSPELNVECGAAVRHYPGQSSTSAWLAALCRGLAFGLLVEVVTFAGTP